MTHDPAIQKRVNRLVAEAQVTLDAIRHLAEGSVDDPLTDADILARAVTTGILDAPHLKNNPFARGTIQTRMIDGACLAIGTGGIPLSETERIEQLFKEDV